MSIHSFIHLWREENLGRRLSLRICSPETTFINSIKSLLTIGHIGSIAVPCITATHEIGRMTVLIDNKRLSLSVALPRNELPEIIESPNDLPTHCNYRLVASELTVSTRYKYSTLHEIIHYPIITIEIIAKCDDIQLFANLLAPRAIQSDYHNPKWHGSKSTHKTIEHSRDTTRHDTGKQSDLLSLSPPFANRVLRGCCTQQINLRSLQTHDSPLTQIPRFNNLALFIPATISCRAPF